jgi:hypothetical protein
MNKYHRKQARDSFDLFTRALQICQKVEGNLAIRLGVSDFLALGSGLGLVTVASSAPIGRAVKKELLG